MISFEYSNYKATLRVTICLLATYIFLVSTGFGPYLTDSYGFRQTQTAITAQYFSSLRDFLEYQTPVLGPPWSIPFEFPLYQALTKVLHGITGVSLESSGRLVSIVFFLLCFWPMYYLLRAWNVRNTHWVMAAVLLAPLYVFWSRAFMIETMALFFTISYLALFVQILRPLHGNVINLLLLTVAGTLGALIKITTLLPLLLITGSVTMWIALHALRRRETLVTPLGLLIVHAFIVTVAFAWTLHADNVKLLNPWGTNLTSAALRDWNFGTLAQRLDPTVWVNLANSTIEIFFPFPAKYSRLVTYTKALLTISWLVLFTHFLICCTRTRRRQVAVLCALFLLPFLLFINLHVVHSYYQVANGFFLCLAFGLAAYGAFEAAPDARRAVRERQLYTVALLIFGLCSFWYLNYRSSHKGELVEVSALVQKISPPDSIIIATGLDWSSVLPYQASRRALMLPDWKLPETAATSLTKLQASGLKVSLYVACGKSTALDLQVRKALALGDRQPLARLDDCSVYPL